MVVADATGSPGNNHQVGLERMRDAGGNYRQREKPILRMDPHGRKI